MEGKPRKPFSDLTNKLSAVSITDLQSRKVREDSSSSLKLSAVSLPSPDVSKPKKVERAFGSKISVSEETKKENIKKVDDEKPKNVDDEKPKKVDEKPKKVDDEKPKKVDEKPKKVKMRPANLNLSEASKVEDSEARPGFFPW